MRAVHLALFVTVTFATASACGTDDDRAPVPSPGASGSSSPSGSGGTSDSAGSGAQSDGGGDRGSQGGVGIEAGGAGGQGIEYETAGAPTIIPGLCDPGMMAGDEVPTDVDPALDDIQLLSMTPDERSILFVTGKGPKTELHVADREDTGEPFEAQDVALPPGYEAVSGAALSTDALSLVLVLADHSGFGTVSRAARGEAFSEVADVTAFSRINAQKPMSGRDLGWPVLASDGKTLYFLSYLKQALVVQSTLAADGRFDLGTEIDEFTLGGGVDEYKRINAVSADQRAIFFFDEATGHAMALFRSAPNAPFYEPLDLGDRRGAVPNADCTRLYSSVAGGLVVQDLE